MVSILPHQTKIRNILFIIFRQYFACIVENISAGFSEIDACFATYLSQSHSANINCHDLHNFRYGSVIIKLFGIPEWLLNFFNEVSTKTFILDVW